jgi:drug/metabolite transporter (DMT)-like permease
MRASQRSAIAGALLSAVLFGASTPAAKVLLGTDVDPFLLAGLFYLGAGLGLRILQAIRRRTSQVSETPLAGRDWTWMAAIVLAGGVAGPALLMIGLQAVPASSSSLLLNLESVTTLLIAWIVFHEHVDYRLFAGAAVIVVAAVLLTWQPGTFTWQPGMLAIAGACVAWGIDNNLTRKLSSVDPLQTVQIKGLAAGSVNVALAFAHGATLPGPGFLVLAGLTGFIGYGLSLVLYTLGLRHLGAARTGAYFATAPFIGATIAVVVLHEPLTASLSVAGLLMGIGVTLHMLEDHAHVHVHEAIEHSHRHVHDEHHQHTHGPDDPPGDRHAHVHVHAELTHSHAHYPDIHHRHRHRAS